MFIDVAEVLCQCLIAVVKWLNMSKLKLNPDKMGVILFGKVEMI